MPDFVGNTIMDRLKSCPRTFPFHAILIAVCVWLSPFASNYEKLFFPSVLPAAVVISAAAVCLIVLFWIVLRNLTAAGILATLTIVSVFYYGYVLDPIIGLSGGAVTPSLFMPIWVALFAGLFVLAFLYRARLQNMTVTAVRLTERCWL